MKPHIIIIIISADVKIRNGSDTEKRINGSVHFYECQIAPKCKVPLFQQRHVAVCMSSGAMYLCLVHVGNGGGMKCKRFQVCSTRFHYSSIYFTLCYYFLFFGLFALPEHVHVLVYTFVCVCVVFSLSLPVSFVFV